MSSRGHYDRDRSRSRSRSPSRDDRGDYSRSRSRSPRSEYSRSRSRSPAPRRRGHSSSRSASRSPPRRNGRRYDSRSPSRSPSRSRSRSRSASPQRSTKIVIEKLSKNIQEQHLRDIFGEYGAIEDLELPLARNTGINRGTAYILYYEEAHAELAISHMHEATVDGAIINVSIVLPRSKFSQQPPLHSRGGNPSSGGVAHEPGPYDRGPPRGSRSGDYSYRPGQGPRRSRSPMRDGRATGYPTDQARGIYRDRSPYSDRSRSRGYGDRRRTRSRSFDSRSRSRSRGRGRGGREYR